MEGKLVIKTKSVNWSDTEKRKLIRAELKKSGWLSGHYLTRHGWNVDKLRKLAYEGQLNALVLNTSGTTTWYYKQADLDAVKDQASHASN